MFSLSSSEAVLAGRVCSLEGGERMGGWITLRMATVGQMERTIFWGGLGMGGEGDCEGTRKM